MAILDKSALGRTEHACVLTLWCFPGNLFKAGYLHNVKSTFLGKPSNIYPLSWLIFGPNHVIIIM